jgi:hypothetical protein
VITFRYFGDIERGSPVRRSGFGMDRRGTGDRPAYRWKTGYVELAPEGHEIHPPVTRREAQALAKARGQVARFI